MGADSYTQPRGQSFSCDSTLRVPPAGERRGFPSGHVTQEHRLQRQQETERAAYCVPVTTEILCLRRRPSAPSSCPHPPEEVGRPPVTQSRAVTGCLSPGNRNLKGSWTAVQLDPKSPRAEGTAVPTRPHAAPRRAGHSGTGCLSLMYIRSVRFVTCAPNP